MTTVKVQGRIVPAQTLAVIFAVGTVLVWLVGGLTPADVAAAWTLETEAFEAFDSGEHAEAARMLERRLAMPVDGDTLGLRSLLAQALSESGQHRAAVDVAAKTLDMALEVAGEDSDAVVVARNDLAWHLLTDPSARPDDFDLAYDLATKAHGQLPDSPFVLGTLGTAELRLGRLDEARTHLEAAIAAHWAPAARATDRAILAIVLAKQGEREAALRALREALAEGRPDEAFRDEAESLLGTSSDKAPPEQPPAEHALPPMKRL